MEFTESMTAVVSALGIELKELDDWNCCGGAAAHSVSNLLGLALPARNIAKAQLVDRPLAISCPGCFNAVRKAQYAMTHDPEMKKQIEHAVGFEYKGDLQVKAMHDVIFEEVGLEKIKATVKKPLAGLKIASYYGCAWVRNPEVVDMGDHENPVFFDELVTALGGEAIDWSYKVDCCGADLGMSHGKIATEIADKLSAAAWEAGANCMLVACGLCQVNVDIRQSGKVCEKMPIIYFTELMGTAMDLPDRDWWWEKHIVDPRPLLKSCDLG